MCLKAAEKYYLKKKKSKKEEFTLEDNLYLVSFQIKYNTLAVRAQLVSGGQLWYLTESRLDRKGS